MDWFKTGTLTLAVLALAAVIVGYGNSIQGDIALIRSEAAADRRQHQEAMDDFRATITVLAERQSRLAGAWDTLQPMIVDTIQTRRTGEEPG